MKECCRKGVTYLSNAVICAHIVPFHSCVLRNTLTTVSVAQVLKMITKQILLFLTTILFVLS